MIIGMTSHLATLALAFTAFPPSAAQNNQNLTLFNANECSGNSSNSSQVFRMQDLGWEKCLNSKNLPLSGVKSFYLSDPDTSSLPQPLAPSDALRLIPIYRFYLADDTCIGQYQIWPPNVCLTIPWDNFDPEQSLSLYFIPNATDVESAIQEGWF
jgi:hypothetical protein